MKHSEIDYVASTEHSYKKPLEAYQRLADASSGLKTEIIPGVEAVSSEGVDIIFLYRSEDQLKQGLKQVQTFRWSVRDVARIAEDTESIVIVPHPFHIGKSSAGTILSGRAYQRLLEMCDYIEIHNGSALTADKRLSGSKVRNLFKNTQAKLDKTLNLPIEDRGEGLGWAVSSDAHYPGEQYVVGVTDLFPEDGDDTFDFLKKRIRFDSYPVLDLSDSKMRNNTKLLRSLQGVIKEGLIKKYLKTLGRTKSVVAICAYYGLLPNS
ncbi:MULTISPECIES: hypothetical protein [unclassified Pseudodesulfovibrio]|uniref:hypothetical protein n=1 Tax=unclassified Pseudodesulfovibrio TaxID=2661612 RepID=UPI000FEB9997|nr:MULTISPECIES: hypothetical protein [unclassified Pseudodesulfovibrio]MCJ2163518.1 hypothetical protein [Pseudodesulfovibrio sp. S3-i]RWU06754.1 hypothetical protein DWB63_03040 [Pseudodesulfovibrio sp. S3]